MWKGVISDCGPSYTQCVKKVCTQKSVVCLKDCLTEPKKLTRFSSWGMGFNFWVHSRAALSDFVSYLHKDSQDKMSMFYLHTLALSLYIFCHKPLPQTLWLNQPETFSTLAKLESCCFQKPGIHSTFVSTGYIITQGRSEWKSLRHLQQIWVAMCFQTTMDKECWC